MRSLYQCPVRPVYGLLITAALLLTATSPLISAQQPTASAGAQPTRLQFTVVDKDRRTVTTLRKEDLQVLEDGQPQQIVSLQWQTDSPISIVLMLDASASQEQALDNAKLGLRQLVNAIFRRGKDSAAVVSFTGEAVVEQDWTSDIERVRRSLDAVRFRRFSLDVDEEVALSTAIWDAIWIVSDEMFTNIPATHRRAIIILTDGQDSSSKKKLDEAAERALKAQAAIFILGIHDEVFGDIERGHLRKLAERTGGLFFAPKTFDDLPAIFEEIKQSLRSHYSLDYLSLSKKSDVSKRKIQVEIVNPELRRQKLRLSHPQASLPK